MSMEFYKNIVFPKPLVFNNKRKHYDDNIYTFDIETISLFYINGEWQPFDYNFDSEFYKDIDKACCPYIWQFGINDNVYYGREFMDFEYVLKGLADHDIEKFIYVHNLSYEMQFLLDIVRKNKWTIENMCARNLRQPISFHIKEINITFRCSYMLTNLSLELSAEKYTDVKKAVGQLDYNIAYSPLSELPEKALYYCEMDIVSLYKVICYYVENYGHVKSIPLTQTGEVRRSFREYVDFYYIKRQWELVPPHHMYCMLMLAFQGGITHANMLYSNRVVYNVWSYDFCSSYPYCMTFKLPSEPFFSIRESEIDMYKDNYCFIYDVTLNNVRATKHNHYLSFSKLTDVVDDMDIESDRPYRKCVDNGRLVKIKSCRVYCTNYDLECIRQSYSCEIVYNHIWVSFAKYLDKRVIEFICDRYVAKTELKGVSEDSTQYQFYMKMKQELNSVYGMAVTNPMKSGIEYDNQTGEWYAHDLRDMVDNGKGEQVMFIDKKLAEMKKSYSTLMYYACGVFITAIARYNLWQNILKLDDYVVYYDTDSIKGIGDKVIEVVDEYNKGVLKHLQDVSCDLNIPLDKFMPADRKGVKHPLGVFECETDKGNYKFFKTLGAKKYAYVDHTGELHMTVSGVRKKASKALNGDINNFRKGFKFGYNDANKLIHFYRDDQPPIDYRDIDGNIYHCKQQHSIILQPTTYTIGLTDEYEYILATLGGMVRDIG